MLAIVFGDDEGRSFLHKMAWLKVDPRAPEDEATQQCRAVAALARDYYLPAVMVEINGIGQFLPAILRREMARMRVPCAVNTRVSTRAKDLRIIEAFDAVLAAQALHVHESVRRTPFINEMREWRPGRGGGCDDGLDAVAGALSLKPARLKYEAFSARQDWHGTGKGLTAQVDFEV